MTNYKNKYTNNFKKNIFTDANLPYIERNYANFKIVFDNIKFILDNIRNVHFDLNKLKIELGYSTTPTPITTISSKGVIFLCNIYYKSSKYIICLVM